MKNIWKNYKHFMIRLFNLIVIVSACALYQQTALKWNREAIAAGSVPGSVPGNLKDGEYSGTGKGFGGDVAVKVSVKDGTITDIQVVEAKKEDAAYLDNAKKIIPKMLKAQSPEVDTASGATFSSNGIINAVKDALKEAS